MPEVLDFTAERARTVSDVASTLARGITVTDIPKSVIAALEKLRQRSRLSPVLLSEKTISLIDNIEQHFDKQATQQRTKAALDSLAMALTLKIPMLERIPRMPVILTVSQQEALAIVDEHLRRTQPLKPRPSRPPVEPAAPVPGLQEHLVGERRVGLGGMVVLPPIPPRIRPSQCLCGSFEDETVAALNRVTGFQTNRRATIDQDYNIGPVRTADIHDLPIFHPGKKGVFAFSTDQTAPTDLHAPDLLYMALNRPDCFCKSGQVELESFTEREMVCYSYGGEHLPSLTILGEKGIHVAGKDPENSIPVSFKLLRNMAIEMVKKYGPRVPLPARKGTREERQEAGKKYLQEIGKLANADEWARYRGLERFIRDWQEAALNIVDDVPSCRVVLSRTPRGLLKEEEATEPTVEELMTLAQELEIAAIT